MKSSKYQFVDGNELFIANGSLAVCNDCDEYCSGYGGGEGEGTGYCCNSGSGRGPGPGTGTSTCRGTGSGRGDGAGNIYCVGGQLV